MFPDRQPGQAVTVRGRLWFHEGNNVDAFIASRMIAGP